MNEFEEEYLINQILKAKKHLDKGVPEDEINAHEHDPFCNKGNLRLSIGPTNRIDKTTIDEKELEDTIKEIAKGTFAIQYLGAGAATRLGKGPIYHVKPKEFSESDTLEEPSIGERYFMQYRLNFEEMAQKLGIEPNDILSNQTIIVHLSEENKDSVLESMKNHNLFGFPKEAFIFVIQKTYAAFVEKDETLVPNPDANQYPFGHGHGMLQLKHPSNTYILDEDLKLIPVEKSPLEYAQNRGVKIIENHRANDMTKLSNDSVCIYRRNQAKKLIEKGHNVVIELVGNPLNQKGGKWLQWNNHDELNHSFLIETINAKSQKWKQAFEKLEEEYFEKHGEGAPYNAFRNYYSIEALKKLLDDGLNASIRKRPDGYTLEYVTGDITHNPKANAASIQIPNELIHDFKEMKNVEELLSFAKQQDENPAFRNLLKNLGIKNERR